MGKDKKEDKQVEESKSNAQKEFEVMAEYSGETYWRGFLDGIKKGLTNCPYVPYIHSTLASLVLEVYQREFTNAGILRKTTRAFENIIRDLRQLQENLMASGNSGRGPHLGIFAKIAEMAFCDPIQKHVDFLTARLAATEEENAWWDGEPTGIDEEKHPDMSHRGEL